jgi:hypothetical protein
MDDLLKEAIADAKAVRETALANAKMALEEAFTPRLKSMLSKKIQSEIEGEELEDEDEEVEDDAEYDGEEVEAPEVEAPEEAYAEADEDPSDEFSDEEEIGGEEEAEAPVEGVIEINGVMYAPVVSEDEEAEVEDEEEEFDGEEDLDLEAVLRELEEELEEGEEEDLEESDEESDETVNEESDKSSEIGKADNKVDQVDSSDVGQGPEKAAGSSSSEAGHENSEDEEVDDLTEEVETEDLEEEIDLEEILKALHEEDDEEDDDSKEVDEQVSTLQSELDEHRNVVKYLRSKLNEVNLLNAKLLFTNKLFRSYGLNNNQKMKVVETFDRAKNLREVKLVYSTMAESFGTKPSREEIVKESKKGSASKPIASTKSEKQEEVLTESDEMRIRFKKLANIL